MPALVPAPAELLAALARALEEIGARWYIFGAQATMIWGRPRMTADVDVTVRLVPDDPRPLVEALKRHGFRLRVDEAGDFVRRTRVLPFLYEPNGLPLDVVLGGPGLEDLFASRAVPVDIGPASVPVICAEDFVATKILAGRPKDLDDVAGVLRERLDRLDLELIRGTLKLLEGALGQSDLIPLFEQAIASARR